MSKKIPLLDLTAETAALWEELNEAIQGVLREGRFIMGPNVKAFEEECASYFGVKHAVALNSGTDALVLGLAAMDIQPGDEVITTPFTFFATAEAISHFRATPVFVDIDPATFNMRVDQIAERITPKTKAIIPVHLYGQSVDMNPILELADKHGLQVLEDVAQAFGAEYQGRKVGALGDAGAFSFFPSKNLGAYGDGGMLITNNDSIADKTRMLRVHGARKKYFNEVVGCNSRLDEIQAAILRVKMRYVDQWNEARRQAAQRYNHLLQAVPEITAPAAMPFATHVYHQYTIRVPNGQRDAVQIGLKEHGIDTMVYYPVPLHKLPLYLPLNLTILEAERAAAEAISLPMGPYLSPEDQQTVVAALREVTRV